MNEEGDCETAPATPGLDGVGPVDNRPTPHKLAQPLCLLKKKCFFKGDKLQVKCDR